MFQVSATKVEKVSRHEEEESASDGEEASTTRVDLSELLSLIPESSFLGSLP